MTRQRIYQQLLVHLIMSSLCFIFQSCHISQDQTHLMKERRETQFLVHCVSQNFFMEPHNYYLSKKFGFMPQKEIIIWSCESKSIYIYTVEPVNGFYIQEQVQPPIEYRATNYVRLIYISWYNLHFKAQWAH